MKIQALQPHLALGCVIKRDLAGDIQELLARRVWVREADVRNVTPPLHEEEQVRVGCANGSTHCQRLSDHQSRKRVHKLIPLWRGCVGYCQSRILQTQRRGNRNENSRNSRRHSQ